MNIFKTTSGNEDCVYISRHPTSRNEPPFAQCISRVEQKPTILTHEEFRITFMASVVQPEGRLTALSACMDIFAEKLKGSLRSGCAIQSTQIAPGDLVITFAGENSSILLPFPVAVCSNRSKTRISRKSSYMQIEAPLCQNVWTSFPALSSSHVCGD
jgi:hypothetical protein